MLTVKQITLAGDEYLWPASNVRFVPGRLVPTDANAGAPVPPHELVFWTPDGEVSIRGGTVFVMNDLGKTVSRYDLRASKIPILDTIAPRA